jgi:hypothetical protein
MIFPALSLFLVLHAHFFDGWEIKKAGHRMWRNRRLVPLVFLPMLRQFASKIIFHAIVLSGVKSIWQKICSRYLLLYIYI